VAQELGQNCRKAAHLRKKRRRLGRAKRLDAGGKEERKGGGKKEKSTLEKEGRSATSVSAGPLHWSKRENAGMSGTRTAEFLRGGDAFLTADRSSGGSQGKEKTEKERAYLGEALQRERRVRPRTQGPTPRESAPGGAGNFAQEERGKSTKARHKKNGLYALQLPV